MTTKKSPVQRISPGLYKFGKTGRIARHPWHKKKWRVIWHDWMSEKQEIGFRSFYEARNFAAQCAPNHDQ